MGAKAKTYRAEPRTRVIRASKVGTAREAIGEITPGCNIFVFTYGQFSLIDALCELLRQAGPSHVTLSTWTERPRPIFAGRRACCGRLKFFRCGISSIAAF